MDSCELEFMGWLAKHGYSQCQHVIKHWNRRRLDIDKDKRPERDEIKPAQREKMYKRQNGLCGICRLPMEYALLKSRDPNTRLEVDHINAHLEGEAYTAPRNLQLAHGECNRKKGADSVLDHAKKTGRTFREIIHQEDEL